MKKVNTYEIQRLLPKLLLCLILLFSLSLSSCLTVDDETTDDTVLPDNTNISSDTTAPVLAEVTPVSTPTTDTTPEYTFSSDEAGTISYAGSCSSVTTSAVSGANLISFNALVNGTYSDCTITVTDASSNASSALSVTSFTINTSGAAVFGTAIFGTDVFGN